MWARLLFVVVEGTPLKSAQVFPSASGRFVDEASCQAGDFTSQGTSRLRGFNWTEPESESEFSGEGHSENQLARSELSTSDHDDAETRREDDTRLSDAIDRWPGRRRETAAKRPFLPVTDH